MAETVLVSGGSGGIGRALCEMLAGRGHRAIAAGRNVDEHDGVRFDLVDPGACESAVATLVARGIEPTAVVFAASPPPEIAPFGRVSDAEMERQWRVNVQGPHRLLAALVKSFFRKRGRGKAIAVLTAAMGEEGDAAGSMAGYVEAKFGLKGVLVAARAEFPWLRTGFVTPGFVETPMLRAFDSRYLDGLRARTSLGRFRSADEVAEEMVALMERLDDLEA